MGYEAYRTATPAAGLTHRLGQTPGRVVDGEPPVIFEDMHLVGLRQIFGQRLVVLAEHTVGFNAAAPVRQPPDAAQEDLAPGHPDPGIPGAQL